MKKIFSIVVVALVALSFNSCKEKNNPDQPKDAALKVEVSNIQATSATVKVTPKDTTAYYVVEIYYAEEFKKLNKDSIQASIKADVAKYQGTPFATFVENNWAFQGVQELPYSALPAESNYTVVAYVIDTTFTILSDLYIKDFSTPKLEVTQTVELKEAGTYVDLSAYNYGSYIEIPVGTNGAYLELNFAEGLPSGAFTEDDFDPEYGAWYVITDAEYYPIATASLTGAMNGADYKLTGEAVAGNGIKFVIDVTCTEDTSLFDAPKKAARKLNRRAL